MPNIYRGIEHLVDIDVLRAVNTDRRNRRWTAPEITTALDAFASGVVASGVVAARYVKSDPTSGQADATPASHRVNPSPELL